MIYLKLIKNSYQALHSRATYREFFTNETIYEIAANSINCLQNMFLPKQRHSSNTHAVGLLTNGPTIFLASYDTQAVAEVAAQHGIPFAVTANSVLVNNKSLLKNNPKTRKMTKAVDQFTWIKAVAFCRTPMDLMKFLNDMHTTVMPNVWCAVWLISHFACFQCVYCMLLLLCQLVLHCGS